jgi:hypothetical protein
MQVPQQKHANKIIALADIPSPNVLIERWGIIEHSGKINAVANIPTADILIEHSTVTKHVREVVNLGHVPLIHVGAVLLQVGVANSRP